MAMSTRLAKSLSKLIFPVILLIVAALAAASVWLTYRTAHPDAVKYLVTPEKYAQLSSRGSQVTDETWTNKDGSTSRGWLLRGIENAPAVVLFHKYGADRSYILNLGVKLNESTNFTVLMPDLRAHGENAPVKNSSFGGCEAEDAISAVEFIRNLKTPNQITLVGKDVGVYGIELGASAALNAAAIDKTIKALVLDSVPENSDALVTDAVSRRFPFASSITTRLAKVGTFLYFFDGCYKRDPSCETAKKIDGRSILLLAGLDAPDFQESTTKLSKCFASGNKIESKTDLSPSGVGIINASIDQSEAYDRRIIDFFRNNLGN
ncbi:MAG TPA: hypothetical protein PLP07_10080 [Pyrinomonadaceae bacterium]|nr:hypothetical protein [Chloracidobacterium sp.]MBP9934714.1 hypothetical protein [Pyrinomonadaceae bacterium]MBK7803254.1 hypothetical protein [Chloracidobacterium sp.]MBK9438101.1 hypothetical protein [Chloracidobacterium sp.]HQX56267.1 hypothetical protein [Pyrinomonadaceae bacterium]